MPHFTTCIPLSLYIHLPWCIRKCPYCDFNSHEFQQILPEKAYIAALLEDFEQYLSLVSGRPLTSIFFGGGTPSLFSPESIKKILDGIHARLPFEKTIEITLEANPGTLDKSRFMGFYEAGINRLSMGIQSLQNDKLQRLGRIHNREQAYRAIESAIEAGFTNFNLDFMYGLPAQSLHEAKEDLQNGLGFCPPHLSWYQLTIEPNTLFYHKRPTLPEDDALWEMQHAGQAILIAAGLTQYEVSAYSKPHYECLHNKNYWEFGDYLGIGAGAHSKLTCMQTHTMTRHYQVKNPKDYLDPLKKRKADHSVLRPEDAIFEFMLNALRLNQGVPSRLFSERTGLPLESIASLLQKAREKNWMEQDPNRLCATPFGHAFLNDLVGLFLPEKN